MAFLTPYEQSALSSRIKQLIAEKTPRPQAIAQAVKEVVPHKARADKLSQQYDTYDTEFGTIVLNVPIYSEHERNHPILGTQRYDLLWLLDSCEAMARHRDEDASPASIHEEHQPVGFGAQTSQPRLGWGLGERIGLARLEGKPAWTIFQDQVIEPGIDAEDVARRLPYRSVEVADPRKPDIASVAFMASRSPYFRYPLLRLCKIDGAPPEDVLLSARHTVEAQFALVCQQYAATMLAATPEAIMADEPVAPATEPKAMTLEDVAKKCDECMAMCQDLAAKVAGLMEDDKPSAPAIETGAPLAPAITSAIGGSAQQFKAYLDATLPGLVGAIETNLAQKYGVKIEAIEKQNALITGLAKIQETIEKDGLLMASNWRETATAYATGNHGTVEQWFATVRPYVGTGTPSGQPEAKPSGSDLPEVMAYAACGLQDQARALAQQFNADDVMRTRYKLADHLLHNLGPAPAGIA